MQYSNFIDKITQEVYTKGIVTKIRDHITRIHNNSDIRQARRWIMELIQNARDVAINDSVDISVELTDTEVRFSHNGKPFRIKDIISIINQVSSKSADEDTVGKFGTGFMSTYQLSDIVAIDSIIQEQDLPYKKFYIELDRSSLDDKTLHENIQKNIETIRNIDTAESINDYNPKALNTTFIYKLRTDSAKEIARVGIEDLSATISYVLLFSSKIKSIEVINKGVSSKFERKSEHYVGYKDIIECTILNQNNEQTLLCVKQKDIYIACMYDKDTNDILPIDEKVPHIFIDFPLFGSEQFPFPVVINSLSFLPDEPRASITLSDNYSSTDSIKNKELIRQAVNMYEELLDYISNHTDIQNVHNILSIPSIENCTSYQSKKWVSEYIHEVIWIMLYKYPVISNKPITRDTIFPETKKLSDFFSLITDIDFPTGNLPWHNILQNYPECSSRVKSVLSVIQNIPKYFTSFNSLEECIKAWNVLNEAVLEDDNALSKIKSSDIAYFICLDSTDKKLYFNTISGLRRNIGLSDNMLKVLSLLPRKGGFNYSNTYAKYYYNLYSTIVHPDLNVSSYNIPEIEISTIKDYFYSGASEVCKYSKFDSIIEVVNLLATIIPDEDVYIYSKSSEVYNPTNLLTPIDFKKCIYMIIKYSENPDNFEEFDRLSTLMNRYSLWHDFKYSFNWPSIDNHRYASVLYWIDNDTDKDLLDILLSFKKTYNEIGTGNFLQKIYDNKLKIKPDIAESLTNEHIASKIRYILDSTVFKDIRVGALTLEAQRGTSNLTSWLEDNPSLASLLFPNIDEDKSQLLLSSQAVKSYRKEAKEFQQFKEDIKVLSPKMLKDMYPEFYKDFYILQAEKLGYEIYKLDIDRDEFKYMSDIEFINFIKTIGRAGEQLAFEYVISSYIEKGYYVVRRSDTDCNLESSIGDKICVHHPEGDYMNCSVTGYDIYVTRGSDIIALYEVKTTTDTSKFVGQIKFTNKQFEQAILQGDKYTLLRIYIDKNNFAFIKCNEYNNVIRCVAEGRLYINVPEFTENN